MNYTHPLIEKAKKFALESHKSTNHFYDEYIDYEFHLRMVVKAGMDFLYLVPDEWKPIVIGGCWTHDTIEDARENYNSVKKATEIRIAEIARACTNLTRGRNRKERMPDWIYDDIRETLWAAFVKLCDRIANVQYSKMTGSTMFQAYKDEHQHFKTMLKTEGYLTPMWEYLENLFETKS